MKKIILVLLMILIQLNLLAMYKMEKRSEEVYGRKVDIYLPQGYDVSSKRYGVVYVMDGEGLTERDKDIAEIERLINKEIIDEYIIVAVYNGGERRTGEYVPFYVDELEYELNKELKDSSNMNIECDNFSKLITEKLVPYIDGKYRTIADREHRALKGGSHGGTVVLWLGINYTGLFSVISAVSPSIWVWEGRFEEIRGRVEKIKTNSKIWLDSGNEEFGAEIRNFISFCESAGLVYGEDLVYYEIKGAGHTAEDFNKRVHMSYIFIDMSMKGEKINSKKIERVEIIKEYTNSWCYKRGYLYFNPVAECENGLKYSLMSLGKYSVEGNDKSMGINKYGMVEFIDKNSKESSNVTIEAKGAILTTALNMTECENEFRKIGIGKKKW